MVFIGVFSASDPCFFLRPFESGEHYARFDFLICFCLMIDVLFLPKKIRFIGKRWYGVGSRASKKKTSLFLVYWGQTGAHHAMF